MVSDECGREICDRGEDEKWREESAPEAFEVWLLGHFGVCKISSKIAVIA